MINEQRAEGAFHSVVAGFSILKKVLFKGDYYFLAQSSEPGEFPTWFRVRGNSGEVSDINPWTDISDLAEFEKLAMRS